MSCCCTPAPSTCCTPAQLCQLDNFGNVLPSLVGPQGPPGGPGLYVENFDALRAIDATVFVAGYVANVGGYDTWNDGGGGQFLYEPASVAADNDGTILAPSNGVGRWRRLYSGAVNAKWFGAKGDNANDDTTPLNNATAFLNTLGGGRLFFPFGTYLTDCILYYDNMTFVPECKGTTIKKRGTAGGTDKPIFDAADNGAAAMFNLQWLPGFVLDGNKAAQGAITNRCGIKLQGAIRVLIDGVEIKDCNLDSILLYGSGPTRVLPCQHVVIRNFILTGGSRTNMAIITAQNITVEDGVMSGAGGAAPNTNLDIERDDAAMVLNSITFRRVDFTDAVGVGAVVVANKSDIRDANIVFDDCGFYDNGTVGFQVSTGGFIIGPITLNNCRSHGNVTNGVWVNETFNFAITGGHFLETSGNGVQAGNGNEFFSINDAVCQGGTVTSDCDFIINDVSSVDSFVGSSVQFRNNRFLDTGARTRWAPRVSVFRITKVPNGSSGCTSANGCYVVNGGATRVDAVTLANPQLVAMVRFPENAMIFKGSVYSVTPVTGVTTATATLGWIGSGTLYSAVPYDLMAAASDTNFLDFTTTDARGTKAADFVRQALTFTGGDGTNVANGAEWVWVLFWGTELVK